MTCKTTEGLNILIRQVSSDVVVVVTGVGLDGVEVTM